jgi:uncharacterized cupredoxin-like copper-binding protein
MKTLRLIACCAAFAASTAAFAHEGHTSARPAATLEKEQTAWGIEGDARSVRRTIDIAMTDDMRFTPSVIEVREGDTVRLRLANKGKDMHELVLGTAATIDEHAAMMKKHPDMEHGDPWMVHVPPGQRGELIWRFNRAGDFDFACLVKDHYELGMAGRVRVLPAASK